MGFVPSRWVHLSKAEQEKIYGHWQKVEPLLVAVAGAKAAKAEHLQRTLGALAYKLKGGSKSGKRGPRAAAGPRGRRLQRGRRARRTAGAPQ